MIRIFAVVLCLVTLSHGFLNFTSLPKGLRKPEPLKSHASPDSRIIGGQATTIEEHPYVVSIQLEWPEHVDGWYHTCTGTIISEDWVLATGQCATVFHLVGLSIRVGSTYHRRGGIVYEIVETITHHLFDEFINDYDLSLMKPNASLVFSNVVQPIRLPTPGASYPEGTVFEMASWGMTVFLEDYAEELQVIELPTITNELCQTVYFDKITDRLFCSYKEDAGMCIGDTGAPAVVDGVLIGIASWHYACSPYGFPSVHVNVPLLVEWITEHTGVSAASAMAPHIGLLVPSIALLKSKITET